MLSDYLDYMRSLEEREAELRKLSISTSSKHRNKLQRCLLTLAEVLKLMESVDTDKNH